MIEVGRPEFAMPRMPSRRAAPVLRAEFRSGAPADTRPEETRPWGESCASPAVSAHASMHRLWRGQSRGFGVSPRARKEAGRGGVSGSSLRMADRGGGDCQMRGPVRELPPATDRVRAGALSLGARDTGGSSAWRRANPERLRSHCCRTAIDVALCHASPTRDAHSTADPSGRSVAR
jgi:hypothetical protein